MFKLLCLLPNRILKEAFEVCLSKIPRHSTPRMFLEFLKDKVSNERDQMEIVKMIVSFARSDSELFKHETAIELVCDARIREYMLLTAMVHRLEGDLTQKLDSFACFTPETPPNSTDGEEELMEKIERMKETYRNELAIKESV